MSFKSFHKNKDLIERIIDNFKSNFWKIEESELFKSFFKEKINNIEYIKEDIYKRAKENHFLVKEISEEYNVQRTYKEMIYYENDNELNDNEREMEEITRDEFNDAIGQSISEKIKKYLNNKKILKVYQKKMFSENPYKYVPMMNEISKDIQEKILKKYTNLIKYIHNIDIELQNKYKHLILPSQTGIFDND